MANDSPRTVVVFSGGLDSTTLLYHLRDEGHEVKALTINYKQRHVKEIEAATAICEKLQIEHRIVDLQGLAGIIGENALMDDTIDVPDGDYSPETIATTTVPNRNMILLSVAIGWAIELKFNSVAYGAHAGEHTNYPDCKPSFASAVHQVAAVCDWTPLSVHAPFINWNKAQIVTRGIELHVPFEDTWSCYNGQVYHCGTCSTCTDRKLAFSSLGVTDPTLYYEDRG